MLPGNRGGVTLWGRDAETHRMFSDHMNGEAAKLTESCGNAVYEWQDTPNDNHFFDCMVGSMVAASVCGTKAPEEENIPKALKLLSSDPVTSISIDGGGSATYDRKGAWALLKELEREERQLTNPRCWMKTVDISGSF